ncbi:MAG: hypothetical protein IT375_20140 [Polyangiaceae bacterium]|nr:hypothetical protein [Polyangiaceae bacterium]
MMKATLQTRYSFTAQFIAGAKVFSIKAAEIERLSAPSSRDITEHRAAVVAAVMQASASLESEFSEVVEHGPGHQLGTGRIDTEAAAFLHPFRDLLERQSGILERWDLLLQLLRRPPVPKGVQPHQDASLLVGLRNELTHYKSRWEGETKRKNLVGELRARRFAPPPSPFFPPGQVNFFPHHVLGAACAKWACQTAAAYIDRVYMQLGIPSVLDGHRQGAAELRSLIPRALRARPLSRRTRSSASRIPG